MIQRKQTLFLLLAVIAIAICLFLPIASIAAKTMGGDTMVYNLGVVGEAGMQISTTCVPLFFLLAVSAIIALVNIFLFKNLKLQKSGHAFCRFMVCRLYRDVHGLDSCS